MAVNPESANDRDATFTGFGLPGAKWRTTMKQMKILALLIGATIACSRNADNNADTSVAIGDTSMAMGASVGTASDSAMAAPSGTSTASGRLDPNSASTAELTSIPGITPALAASIEAGRPYADNRAVAKALASLSDQQRDSVYTRLWIPLDLNKASGDEILLIPGVGARMRREFLEYRPYASIEQFRREIGKYVDKAEVARLESYVKI
jgi:DNA uptake protein ComE-like DNA-binding protein